MPYVCSDENRYLGEHCCDLYHYGNMSLIRQCCIDDCRKWADIAVRVAMTTSHPAYRLYTAAFNSLTDAEQKQVPHLSYSFNKGIHDPRR